MRFVGINGAKDEPLRQLIERVKRDRKEEDEFHIPIVPRRRHALANNLRERTQLACAPRKKVRITLSPRLHIDRINPDAWRSRQPSADVASSARICDALSSRSWPRVLSRVSV